MATIYDDPVLAPGVAGNEHLTLPADTDQILRNDGQQVVRALERAFGQAFTVLDPASGHVIRPAADSFPVDLYKRMAALYEIAQRGRPEVVDEVSPLLLMAVPLPANPTEPMLVALATFVTEPVEREEQIKLRRRNLASTPSRPFSGPRAAYRGIRTPCRKSPPRCQKKQRCSKRRPSSSGSWPTYRRTC